MKTKEDVNIEEEIEERPNDIAEVIEQIKPYWTAIAGVLVVVVGGLIALNLFSTGQQASREAGWSDFLSATANRDPSQLQELADSSSGNVAAFAQQAAAQAKLIEASAAVHRERGLAKTGYEEAVQGFTKVLEQASGQDLIQKQALMGLGQAHEGLNDLAKAKEQYQQIVDKWPDSSIAKEAKSHLDRLNDPKSKEFYDWFFAQTPPTQLPASGEVPGLPSFDAPPSTPDIPMPELPGAGDSSAAETGTSDATADAATETTDTTASVDATLPVEETAAGSEAAAE